MENLNHIRSFDGLIINGLWNKEMQKKTLEQHKRNDDYNQQNQDNHHSFETAI